MSVVISRLVGGLGNQIFQYAAALAVARRHGVPYAFEQNSVGRGSAHDVGLPDAFDVDVPEPTPRQWRSVFPVVGGLGTHRFRRRLRGLLPGRVIVEPSVRYWPGFESVQPPCYLVGTWASPRYFATIVPEIRERLRFRIAGDGPIAGLGAEAAGCESVAVHVRGGDYLRSAKALAFHGVCSPAYYEAAFAWIEARVAQPYYFVFSDDPERARAVVPLRDRLRYVPASPGPSCYQDMYLISRCRHQVIANSTFGWWGAWLSTNASGIRIAPATWLQGTGYAGEDLVPPEWIRLPETALSGTGSSRTRIAADPRVQALHGGSARRA